MSTKILILALTCLAMANLASADVVATTCDAGCDGTGMANACTTTINACVTALGSLAAWLVAILVVVLDLLLTSVVAVLVILILVLGSALCIGLLNLILTIIVLLINIILRWLAGLITTVQCRILIGNWYSTSYLALVLYSTNPLLVIVINVCLTIILNLYNGCLLNVI